MTNQYYLAIKDFEKKVTKYAIEIFKVYGNELQLRLEEYNLLAHDKNCLESSTAFGYIIEEFLVSKLEIYSKSHIGNEYKIQRTDGSTTTSSYDCFSLLKSKKIKILVNIKADKKNNNAIAAINSLYNDYIKNLEEVKAYLILKIHYSVKKSDKDSERKIFIDKIDSFFLEEIDFSQGHRQDSRNWSKEYKSGSGRLQVSETFRNEHQQEKEKISYENTKKMLKLIAKQ